MKQDRAAIHTIIGDMLGNPDKRGIYPTSTAFQRLELYIEQQRINALGWTLADCCLALDNGDDPPLADIPGQIARMQKELGGQQISEDQYQEDLARYFEERYPEKSSVVSSD